MANCLDTKESAVICCNHNCNEGRNCPLRKPISRNDVLEEIAKRFDAMRSLGDTAASFAAYVRNMKS